MIVRVELQTRDDGLRLFKSFSDRGVYIRQIETGSIYVDAIDVEGASYQYEETEMPIEDYSDKE